MFLRILDSSRSGTPFICLTETNNCSPTCIKRTIRVVSFMQVMDGLLVSARFSNAVLPRREAPLRSGLLRLLALVGLRRGAISFFKALAEIADRVKSAPLAYFRNRPRRILAEHRLGCTQSGIGNERVRRGAGE